jgi:hypothetical protein
LVVAALDDLEDLAGFVARGVVVVDADCKGDLSHGSESFACFGAGVWFS